MKKKREKEILHNYMEVLASNYEGIEPDEMADSICKIYDRLNPAFNVVVLCAGIAFVNFLICILVFVKNFFWRKS